jgi:hypothetical protein
MIKNINGKEVSFKDRELETIEDLYELTSYTSSCKKEKIIGFARFKPFLDNDNRFCNQLFKNVWYPVLSTDTSRDLYLQIEGVAQTHLGLFDDVVAVKGHEKKFSKLTNDNPRVAKYFNKKQKEKNANEKYLTELHSRLEKEELEKKAFQKERGNVVHRKPELTQYLRNSYKEEKLDAKGALFEKAKNPEYKKRILNDITYRLKNVEIFKSLDRDKNYYYFFDNGDKNHEKQLTNLKEEIINFDFTNEKSFDIFKEHVDTSITSFLKDKFSSIINLTKNKNKINKPK